VAQKIFARHGLAKTTLDDIAIAVGMKKASLYYYFENKEEIFGEVITQESHEFLKELKDSISKEKNQVKKILRYAKVRLDYFRRMMNLHDLSIHVILEMKPVFDKLYSDFRNKEIELISEIIDEAVRQGRFKPCKASKVASAMLIISDALKFSEFCNTTMRLASEVDYSKVEKDTDYILKLIISGLVKT
jgi:AcrR family transcriptional regulator